METKTIEIQDAQSHLKELVSQLDSGAEIVLTEGNKPVARLVSLTESPAQSRVPGLHQGSMWTSDNFDDPLPETFWTGTK